MNQLIAVEPGYLFNCLIIGDRHRPVMLVLHGFMGSCNDFKAVVTKPDFCWVLVDLPGHGETEVEQDEHYLMPKVAQALVQLLNKLNIEQCSLWGYSMGGRVALYLAVYFPQYFQSVILESASPGLKTQEERDRRIEKDLKLARKLELISLPQFLEQWYNNPLFESLRQHSKYQRMLARRLQNNPLKLAKSLRLIGLGVQPSLWESVSGISVPLILIVGAFDSKFIAINYKMLYLSSKAKINIVEGSGHNVHFEQPLKLSQLIKQVKSSAS